MNSRWFLFWSWSRSSSASSLELSLIHILLYTALVAYLVYHARPEERDLNSLMLLLSLAEAREEDESLSLIHI